MPTIFGSDVSPLIKFPLFLIAILAIVGVFYVVLRRMTGARLVSSGPEQGRSRQPRLGVVDVYDLDRTRQLVLLRRDNVEHLLLIGGPNDTVIETNIVRVAGGRQPVAPDLQFERAEQQQAAEPSTRPLAEYPVRPVIEGAVARPVTAERPVFGEPAFAPAPAVPIASQETVSAASFAAVAAATQHEHIADPTEVPDFLRTHHDHRTEDAGAFAGMIPEASPAQQPPPPSFLAPEPLMAPSVEPEPPYQKKYQPVEPLFPAIPPATPLHQAPPPSFLAPEPLVAPAAEPEPPYQKKYQPAEPLFPVIPQATPLRQPEPAEHIEPVHIEPAMQEPIHRLELEPVLTAIPAAPVFEPETAIEPEPRIEAEPRIEPEPGLPPIAPHSPEERWSRNTPFAGLDSSLHDYSKFPIRLDPLQSKPATTEEAITPSMEHEPVAPVEPHPVAAVEAPVHLDETVLSDMARQLEEALMSRHVVAPEPAPEPLPEPLPETEIKTLHVAEIEEAIVAHDEEEEPVIAKLEPEPKPAQPPAAVTPAPDAVTPPAEPPETESKPEPKPAANKNDPFSLDDIEAEFARLLGRTEKSGKV